MIELLATDWSRILGWQSPIGLAIFFLGLGTFIWLLGRADRGRKEKKEE